MANTKSAQKAMRQAERRAVRNQAARAAVRTYVKKASVSVALGTPSDGTAEAVRAAVRALDEAAHKGIVHPNAAARRKSRLMSRLHQLSVAPAPIPVPDPGATASRSRSTTTRGVAGRRPAAKTAAGENKPTVARKPAVRKPAAKKD